MELPWDTGYKEVRLGRILDFDASRFVSAPPRGRASQFALAASKMALEDAGLLIPAHDPERIGFVLGTALGPMPNAFSVD